MNADTGHKKIHQGRNVKRLREMLGIKQEALAFDLGIGQTTMSDYEQKEELDEKLLTRISEALKVPVEAIKNMNDDTTYNYINTFNNSPNSNGVNYNCTFNPLDKVIELYERMIKDRDAMIERLSNK